MAFNWEGYFLAAKKLKSATDGKSQTDNGVEALRRTAVSRAYYSVFHLAVTYAENNLSYVKPSQSYHPHIRLHYTRQMTSPNYQEVGKLLFKLHTARVKCDYHSDGVGNIESLLGSVILDVERVKFLLT